MQLLLQCYMQCGGIGQLEWNKCKCNALRPSPRNPLETAGPFSFIVNYAGFFEVVEVWSGTTLKTNWIYKIYFSSFMSASFTFSYLDLKRISIFSRLVTSRYFCVLGGERRLGIRLRRARGWVRVWIFSAIPFKLGQNFYEFVFTSHDPKCFGHAE